ncbi:MAG TPA: hypothetical protein VEY07_00715 [Thermoplasmata archaeon]|nr:hypothetical protein [Thermoplasmata archaeon]
MPASEPAASVPPSSRVGELAPAPAPTSPVAVVWCRQVDNEAESPGYTTVPEEFPGLKETLEAIRIVGHLTVNVADTHDYWDPDPSQPLSYYPNIFLYPAYGGRYTCLGRMFLSTEDRPRLGMKTLVLDTGQLLASGDFGGSVLRWHASMGGPRLDAARPAPAPDGRLYDLLGEGFLFHKGSTDPVVAVASDEWESAMQVVLDLVRSLPASLVALGAILAFPYFLPQPKTNLHEFTEQLPLALALMRVPRGEAAGDRHDKRMSSWESAPITLRDLTAGYPAPSRGKETTPLVLQHVRDHNVTKLTPIVQRVDVVEMPRLKGHLADPERQGGRDRRKEMWRIGTAMESAALLLQRARGRQVPVNVETAKRAQEYIQARLPDPSESPPSEPAPVAVIASDLPASVQHPPWLQRPASAAPAPAPRGPEAVPVPVSEDPSLLNSAARPAPPPLQTPTRTAPPTPTTPSPSSGPASTSRPAGPTATASPSVPAGAAPALAPRGPTLGPTLSVAELGMLKQSLGQEFLRLVDERMALLAAKAPRPPPGLDPAGQQQVDDRLKSQREQLTAEFLRLLAALQEKVSRDQSAIEIRQRDLLTSLVNQAMDRRWVEQVEPKIAQGFHRIETSSQVASDASLVRLKAELDRLGEDLRTSVAAQEESLQSTLSAQLDLHLREAAEREEGMRSGLSEDLSKGIDLRLAEIEAHRTKELRELEQKVSLLIDGRQREFQEKLLPKTQVEVEKLRQDIEHRLSEADGRLRETSERVRSDVQDAQVRAMADLQVRLQAYTDQKLREDVERERQKYIELLARLKGEVDSSTQKLLESPKFDATLREKTLRLLESQQPELQRSLEAHRADLERSLEARVMGLEAAGKLESAEAGERLRRLETAIESARGEFRALDESVRSELDDLDRRAQILADRLVPVVRKTWQRISDLEKSRGRDTASAEVEALQHDLQREVRRLTGDMEERFAELRDRMETTISNQGRVWLTLVRQLSQLTEDRRVIEENRALQRHRGTSADASDETTSLEALPSLLHARGREPVDDEDEEDDESSSATRARRRRRPFSRS